MATGIKQWAGRFARITSGGNFIPEIDGLRFLAIGAVLLFHASYALIRAYRQDFSPGETMVANLFARGALGVELFFVISGFILALPFARAILEDGKPVEIRHYYLRRVTRLEPPYIITLVVVYAVAWLTKDPAMQGRFLSTFFARLFYLHGLIYQDAPAVNGVTWSLEMEVQFYVLMPLLARIFYLPAAVRRTGLLLVVLFLPQVQLHGLLLFSVLSQLPLFFAGFLFADFYIAMQQHGAAKAVWNDFAAFLVFALVLALPIPMQSLRRALPLMILIFLALMFNGIWLRRFFSWKPVYLIGGMCYSIYLIHYPLISTFCRWLAHSHPGMSYFSSLALVVFLWLPVVVAIAAVFFALVEHPCMDREWPRKLMRRLKR